MTSVFVKVTYPFFAVHMYPTYRPAKTKNGTRPPNTSESRATNSTAFPNHMHSSETHNNTVKVHIQQSAENQGRYYAGHK